MPTEVKDLGLTGQARRHNGNHEKPVPQSGSSIKIKVHKTQATNTMDTAVQDAI